MSDGSSCWQLLMSPATGAVIGYCANRLAVKSIFWPRRPLTVFGLRVPMTPGMFVARRREFALAFARALVARFTRPEDLISGLGRALDAGLEDRVFAGLTPMAALVLRQKLAAATSDQVRSFADGASQFLAESGVIEALVADNVEALGAAEVEAMVREICGKELRVMALFDAGVGALVGLGQALATWWLWSK